MNQFRGILMLLVGAFALYRGWMIHRGQSAWLALGLGLLAIGLGAWRLTRKPAQPRL
jgi:hypothetical protein